MIDADTQETHNVNEEVCIGLQGDKFLQRNGWETSENGEAPATGQS
jgi:hypothetical protein